MTESIAFLQLVRLISVIFTNRVQCLNYLVTEVVVEGVCLKPRMRYTDLGGWSEVYWCPAYQSWLLYGPAPAVPAEFMRKLSSAVRTALHLLTVPQDSKSWECGFQRDSGTRISWGGKNCFLWFIWEGWNLRVEFFENKNERMRCECWGRKSLKDWRWLGK